MSDTITVTGLVATPPHNLVTSSGLAVTTFRLASNQRRYDRATGKWVDGDTNWYTVATFRSLAANVVLSVQKGQRVLVTGRLKVRDWETDEKKGRTVEIEAEALGHDLSWGTAAFTRSAAAAVAEAEAEQPQVESQADSTASELGDIPEQEPLGTPVREPQADEVAAPF